MFKAFLHKFNSSSERTRLAVKNIAASFAFKFISIVVSLMVIPLTINYLDSYKYGIWVTVSTIIAWVHYFDFGLANGFRNKFAEAKATENITLCRKYVSTTYAIMMILMVVVFGIFYVANLFLNWCDILNLPAVYEHEIKEMFVILTGVLCIQMIADVLTKLFAGDQRPAYNGLITIVSQVLSLAMILFLVHYTQGSLIMLAAYFSSIPTITLVIATFFFFKTKHYKPYRPSIKYIDFKLSKNIIGMGVKFFLLQISIIAILQLMNLVLTRNCGADSVTLYNVAYKYFSILLLVMGLIVNPLWSAFTDAFTKKDIAWMRGTLKKCDQMNILVVLVGIVAYFVAPTFYKLWIGDTLQIPDALSLWVMIFAVAQTIGFVYMTLINGIGRVKIQTILFCVFAVMAFPVMSLSTRNFGVIGIVFLPTTVYLAQTLFLRIQLKKLVNGNEYGIWAE